MLLNEVLEIVKSQATIRSMSAEEILAEVKKIMEGLQSMETSGETVKEPVSALDAPIAENTEAPVYSMEHPRPISDVQQEISKEKIARTAIKENYIKCLECGGRFRVLTKKHLATHDLTPELYRLKYGYSKKQALACRILVKARRNQIHESKIWEHRSTFKHTDVDHTAPVVSDAQPEVSTMVN